jgi:hypothetical protein
MPGIFDMISFLTFGTSEKKVRAKRPATVPKPAAVRPLYHEPVSHQSFVLLAIRPSVSMLDFLQRKAWGRLSRIVTYALRNVTISIPYMFGRIL